MISNFEHYAKLFLENGWGGIAKSEQRHRSMTYSEKRYEHGKPAPDESFWTSCRKLVVFIATLGW